MSRKNTFISCVICSYNREKYIADAIASMANQTLDKDRYEVVLVNNNSTDATGEICQQMIKKHGDQCRFKYVVEQQQGLSHARNRGIREASGQWICYIDDDAIAEPDFLEHIAAFLSAHPDAGGLGGKVLPKYVHGKPAWMNPFMEGLVSKVDHGEAVQHFTGRNFPLGCNMVYRKDLLEAIGGFDPDLGRKGSSGEASEEKDVFFKLIRRGHEVFYLPGAVVEHVIEKERLQYPYIQKISEGIGRSERLRTAKKGQMARFIKFMELVYKFGGACVLAGYYLIRIQPQKSKALVLFRVNVFRGWCSA